MTQGNTPRNLTLNAKITPSPKNRIRSGRLIVWKYVRYKSRSNIKSVLVSIFSVASCALAPASIVGPWDDLSGAAGVRFGPNDTSSIFERSSGRRCPLSSILNDSSASIAHMPRTMRCKLVSEYWSFHRVISSQKGDIVSSLQPPDSSLEEGMLVLDLTYGLALRG